MEIFRDLYIHANADTMASAIEEMEKALPADWVRDTDTEARVRASSSTAKRVTYCFKCEAIYPRRAAILFLTQKDPSVFYVSNIVPIMQSQLKYTEYNNILEDFYERVFEPQAVKARLDHQLTDATAGLENWMDEQTANLLRAFSTGANKGTGASHPEDRKRWNAFVHAAHHSRSQLDSLTLARWLVEEEDWPPEVAEQLALEYESGRELLSYSPSR